jgi:hypothetical protein
MLPGQCACGAVQYQLEDRFRYAGYCHCSQCRRATGSAFSVFGGIDRNYLRVVSGGDALATFDKSPDDVISFCRHCGTNLFSIIHDSSYAHVQLGTLMTAPRIRPSFHSFVGSKAEWDEINDTLPQFIEHPRWLDETPSPNDRTMA